MAEVTAFRNNALPYPVYAQSWTVVFPLLDADGDPISPSSPDSERSLNGDTFGDCTNEAVEIATSSGVCYLILTAAEMTADIVTVRIQSTGAKTTILTLYPRKLPVLSTGTCQGSNDTGDIQLASGDSAVDDTYNGCLVVAVIDSVTEARIINDYVGSTKVAEVSPAWVQAQPDSNDTYTIYLPEGRQVAHVARVTLADTVTTYTGNTVQTGDSYAIVNNGTHGNAALKTLIDTLDDFVDTEVAAIKAKTDNLPSDPADASVIAARFDTLDTSVGDLPTNAELATALGTADDATLAAIAALNNLSQANIRTAVGLASANLDTQLDALPTNAELATALGTADDATLAAIAALNNLSSAQAQTAAAAAITAAQPIQADIRKVNNITVDGAGTSGNPWGPA